MFTSTARIVSFLASLLLATTAFADIPKRAPAALSSLFAAAMGGNPQAEQSLGQKYLRGDGIAKNEALGLMYIRAAAQQGYDAAEWSYSIILSEGLYGATKDSDRNLQLMTSSAEQGYVPAEVALAEAYKQGHDAPHEPVQAAVWAIIASKAGCDYSTKVLLPFTMISLSDYDKAAAEKLAAAFAPLHQPTHQDDLDAKFMCRVVTTVLRGSARSK